MEREKLKDTVLIFLVVFFWIVMMNVLETILEFSFIQSELLRDVLLIAGASLLFGFLLLKVIPLFKGEEYREFFKRTKKSRYTMLFVLLPLIILLWIVQSQIIDPLLGNLLWKTIGTIVFLFVLLIIGFAVSRKF